MLSIKLIDSQNLGTRLVSQLRSEVKKLADSLYTEIRKTTPVDTGYARAGWTKKVSAKSFEIANQVPYIGVLDKGRRMTNKGMRGSKQAPQGIIGPSLKSIKGKN
jgi:hypothetical protein